MTSAPIVLFVYNRPDHTRRTIEALRRNAGAAESELYVYSDGAKNAESELAVREVRKLIHEIEGFRHVTVVEREQNLGLARSIVSGVTDVVNRHGRIIVLEDDLVTHPQFLEYMNGALEKYADDRQVFAITGHSFLDEDYEKRFMHTFFLTLTSCWSWGTWSNRWALFDSKAAGWEEMKSSRDFRRMFNYDNSYDYYNMIIKRMEGKVDSWAILWYWTIFNKKGLTLYPNKTLVQNIGLDGTGTHGSILTFDDLIIKGEVQFDFSEDFQESVIIRKKIADLLRKKKTNFLRRFLNKIARVI